MPDRLGSASCGPLAGRGPPDAPNCFAKMSRSRREYLDSACSVNRGNELRQLSDETHDVTSVSALRETVPFAACNELTPLDGPGRWVTVSEAGIDCCLWVNAQPDVAQSVIEATRSFYQIDALRLLRHLLRPAPRIIDVGANIGNHSVPLRTTRALPTWFFARRRPPAPWSGSLWKTERRR